MGIGLLILSEHNKSPCDHPSWASSLDSTYFVALTRGAGLVAEEIGAGTGFGLASDPGSTGVQLLMDT